MPLENSKKHILKPLWSNNRLVVSCMQFNSMIQVRQVITINLNVTKLTVKPFHNLLLHEKLQNLISFVKYSADRDSFLCNGKSRQRFFPRKHDHMSLSISHCIGSLWLQTETHDNSFKTGTNLGQVCCIYGATNQIATFLMWLNHMPILSV